MMSEGPNIPTTLAVPSSVLIDSNRITSADVFISTCGSPFFQMATASAVNLQSIVFAPASRSWTDWALAGAAPISPHPTAKIAT